MGIFFKQHLLWVALFSLSMASFGQQNNNFIGFDSTTNNKADFQKIMENFENIGTEFHRGQDTLMPKDYLKYAIIAETWAIKNELEDDVQLSKFYQFRYHYAHKNYTKIIQLGNELLYNKTFQKHKEIIHVCSWLKRSYLELEQYQELLDMFPVYQKMYQKHKFYVPKSDFINDRFLSIAHYKLKNYSQAIKYYKNRANNSSRKFYITKSGALNDIGLCFIQLNEKDSARFYYDLSMKNLKDNGFVAGEYTDGYAKYFYKVVASNKADLFFDTKEYNKALPFYKDELAASLSINEPDITSSALFNIANVYYHTGKYKQSIAYLDSTLAINKKSLANKGLAGIFNLKAKNYAFLGNKQKANYYFNKGVKYTDSISIERSKINYFTSFTKFELARKESDLLVSKHKIKTEKNKNQFISILLGIFGLVALNFYWFYRKATKDKNIIQKQKNAAEKNVKEKETLLKEIHHRVKNNLQVISSLLDLQVNQLNNPKFKAMVDDAQNKIQSISLVHQMLYQKKDLTSIKLNDYITQLCKYIQSVRANKKVKIIMDMGKKEASIEKAIPLGLIVTELISNSYKHAFSGINNPTINICIKEQGGNTFLYYTDNGQGLKKSFEINKQKSLGFRLIKLLVEEMDSEFEIIGGSNFGIKILCNNY